MGSKGAFGFQHPVRLYLPISKRQEYLQSSGEKVLASFPVQATIHFYNDELESGSEEEEQGEEGRPWEPRCQEADSPGMGAQVATAGPAAEPSGGKRRPPHGVPQGQRCTSSK